MKFNRKIFSIGIFGTMRSSGIYDFRLEHLVKSGWTIVNEKPKAEAPKVFGNKKSHTLKSVALKIKKNGSEGVIQSPDTMRAKYWNDLKKSIFESDSVTFNL